MTLKTMLNQIAAAGSLVHMIILAVFFLGIVISWFFSSRKFSFDITVLKKRLKEENEALRQSNELLKTDNIELDKLLAVSEQENLQIQELKKELLSHKSRIDQLMEENTFYQTKIAELKTQIEEEKKLTKEKLALLDSSREELKNQFELLSGSILDRKSKAFTQLNRENLDLILKPFNEEIKGFKKKIDEIYISEARERSSLKTELDNLKNLNQQLNKEAMNLTRALKGDKKAQGTWGELILENVLEQSGLRNGAEYETQTGFRDRDNKLLKPDVIIHLPEGKDIVVDSKVSLVDYEKYCASDEDKEKAVHLENHVAAIRNHISTLSSKDYTSLKGVVSLDFVLMFIPVEPAFIVAFQHDENLFSQAFSSRIVIVTPTTLLATLRTIENIWRYEKQNRSTILIAEKAGALYDKLRGFVEDIEKLGTQMATANKTYENAVNKLTRGRGNLISQTQQFLDLGIKVKKEISKSVLERSELEKLKIEDSDLFIGQETASSARQDLDSEAG